MAPRNIVFILSDQHNPSVAGFAGNPIARTPSLDRLSRQGITFDNCYSSSPLCVPSRTSMLCGQLPSRTGVLNNFQALASHMATFVHSLSLSGYETVLCGRMHFNGPDQRHGFEKRLVGDLTPSLPGLTKDVFGDALRGADSPAPAAIEKAGPGNSAVLDYDADVCDAAIDFLSSRSDERPLFLLIGFFGPHCPYVAPPDLYEYYKQQIPTVETPSKQFRESVHPAIQKWYANRRIENVTADQTARVRAAYYGMVESLDSLIGRTTECIERNLNGEDTMVLYASDHGDALGDNGLFWKTNFYDGSARVPLIFSWPSMIPSGKRVSQPVSLMDVGPTLISSVSGLQLPNSDGVSIRNVLFNGEGLDPERAVFSQLGDVKGDTPSAMVRKGRWKLVSHLDYEHPQLFDIENDPKEIIDLGKEPKFSQVKEELLADLGAVWNEEHIRKLQAESAEHGRLYKEWVEKTNQKGIEDDEWHGDVTQNSILQ